MVQVVDCLFMCFKVCFKSGRVFPGVLFYTDEVQVEIFKCALNFRLFVDDFTNLDGMNNLKPLSGSF